MKQLIKNILISTLSLFIIIVFSILYINSLEIYKDEYGIDISYNMDYLIFIIIGIAILIYSIYNYVYKKTTNPIYLFITTTSLLSFYPLGVFFKAMSKGKMFGDYQNYLYLGIISLLLLFICTINLITMNTKNANESLH